MLGLLFIFALCLAPSYLLLAPWVAQQEGIMVLDVPHTFSLEMLSFSSCLDLLICFSVPSSPQDSWMLSCHRVGGRGIEGEASSLAYLPASRRPPARPGKLWLDKALWKNLDFYSDATTYTKPLAGARASSVRKGIEHPLEHKCSLHFANFWIQKICH